MLQGLMNKLAASKGSFNAPAKQPKKMNLRSAFRGLAIKRKVKGKAAGNSGSQVDNADQSY